MDWTPSAPLKAGDIITMDIPESLSWFQRQLVRLGVRQPPRMVRKAFKVASTTEG